MYMLKIQVFITQQCTDSDESAGIQIRAVKLIFSQKKNFGKHLFRKLWETIIMRA